MRVYLKKNNLDKTVLILWLAFTYLGCVSKFIVTLTGGFGYVTISWAFFLYFAVFYLDGLKSWKKSLTMFLPFLVFAAVYSIQFQFVFRSAPVTENAVSAILGKGVKIDVWNMFLLLPFVGSCVFLLIKSDAQMKYIVKYVTLMIFGVASVYGFIMGLIDPNFIRNTAAGTSDSFVTYGTIYALVILIPVVLYLAVRAQGKKKAAFVAISLLYIGCVMVVEFFIGIIATVVGIVLFVFGLIKNKRLMIALAVALFVLVLFLAVTGYYADLLRGIARIVPLDYIGEKIEQTILFLETGEFEGSGIRFEMYFDTFLMFLKHPFFGNIIWYPEATDFFVNEAGKTAIYCGHSTNLDVLSCCGILVFSLYAYFFVIMYKEGLRGKTGLEKYTVLISAGLYIFISSVNTVFGVAQILPAIIFLVPCLMQKDIEIGMLTGEELL